MGQTQGRTMRETNGAPSSTAILFALVTAVSVAGCTSAEFPAPIADAIRTVSFDRAEYVTRHIEIALDDPASSLPCSVVDRPDSDTRNVLWRAEHELGFCQKKADETLVVLKRQGWACRPENSDERRSRIAQHENEFGNSSHVIAAWRCLEGLTPTIEEAGSQRPHVPEVKPELDGTPPPESLDDRLLLAAVERDLAVIGQDVVDDQTDLESALGDLNEDGNDDAVVIVTRSTQPAAGHRLLMAYLRRDDTYQLVDVWVLRASETSPNGPLNLTIEDGRVRFDDCCEDSASTILVLDDRKLAHADGG